MSRDVFRARLDFSNDDFLLSAHNNFVTIIPLHKSVTCIPLRALRARATGTVLVKDRVFDV